MCSIRRAPSLSHVQRQLGEYICEDGSNAVTPGNDHKRLLRIVSVGLVSDELLFAGHDCALVVRPRLGRTRTQMVGQ